MSLTSRIDALAVRFAYPLHATHFVELVKPLWGNHALHARVEKVWDGAKDLRTLTLPRACAPSHTAAACFTASTA